MQDTDDVIEVEGFALCEITLGARPALPVSAVVVMTTAGSLLDDPIARARTTR